jgi:hypothetical protein
MVLFVLLKSIVIAGAWGSDFFKSGVYVWESYLLFEAMAL